MSETPVKVNDGVKNDEFDVVQNNFSRSGHNYCVSDHPEDGYILIQHRAGHHIFLDDDGSIQICAQRVLSLIHI